ncbi:MAG TPA: ThuA domain-containing protein [Bacteroidales bacterium]|nr:ThuA domain-containing protein [Bacteroidales bacterium]
MKFRVAASVILIFFAVSFSFAEQPAKNIRVLVITGGHDYAKEEFNKMLSSLGENITCSVEELPGAFSMFLPENRDNYDVLVFYHMWQSITSEQAEAFADCIRQGKPLVALHHSICAFDDWPEYFRIIGGKYFHKPTEVDGKTYPACSYQHDLHFMVNIAAKKHPVTKGIKDFEIFDETYNGYYIEPGVTPLLTTSEPTSVPVIGWTKNYGKARVVTIQSGHDVPTFEQPEFRKLLGQAVRWVYNEGK